MDYTRTHKLKVYCAFVTSATLLLLILQVFAGVHT